MAEIYIPTETNVDGQVLEGMVGISGPKSIGVPRHVNSRLRVEVLVTLVTSGPRLLRFHADALSQSAKGNRVATGISVGTLMLRLPRR